MDLRGNGHDIPNPYGLLAADFDFDTESYGIALSFLGDLASGSTEDRALQVNGGTQELMRSWANSAKFRRVLGKCRQASERERAYQARSQETAPTDAVRAGAQRFIPADELTPAALQTIKRQRPSSASQVNWPPNPLPLP